MGSIFDSDFLDKLFIKSSEIGFYQILQMTALILSSLVGTIIKGGIFTYKTSFIDFQNTGFTSFVPNPGTLCIQFVETMVLDSCEIVYSSTMQSADTSGPFIYRENKGYDNEFLVYDTVFLVFRVILAFISSALYCPDYFEFLVG